MKHMKLFLYSLSVRCLGGFGFEPRPKWRHNYRLCAILLLCQMCNINIKSEKMREQFVHQIQGLLVLEAKLLYYCTVQDCPLSLGDQKECLTCYVCLPM